MAEFRKIQNQPHNSLPYRTGILIGQNWENTAKAAAQHLPCNAVAGQGFMAKAVEVETKLQGDKWKK
jgi:hypothetical protein